MSDVKHKELRPWKERLVHRKYIELADPQTAGHFSARIEHDGTGCYFPLGSADETGAALRAQEIQRWVEARGWNSVRQRFAREFTLAIFWSSNPLLCTYTTLLTLSGQRAPSTSGAGGGARGAHLVLIEADEQVRLALVDWSRRLPEFRRVDACADLEEAQRRFRRTPANLVLFNRSLPELQLSLTSAGTRSGAFAAFAFGVYETSDDIFISHTGVSRGYFLHRTAPTDVLAPVAGCWNDNKPTLEHILLRTRDYFQNLIFGAPGVSPSGEKAALTPREEEILLRLSKGYQDKQIADTLNISTWTVHNHIKNIFKKLGVHTRTQAVIKHLQR